MSLITLILVLVIIGVVLFVINRYVPMDDTIKRILNWVIVLVVIIWLLKALGVWAWLSQVNI